MTKWKGATRPQGAQRVRVLEEAERLRARDSAAAHSASAVLAEVTADSRYVELARISGYVEAVRDMVLQVALRQADILGMLQPWVAAEARTRAHPDAPAVKQAAKEAPAPTRAKAGSPRPGKDPAAQNTARLLEGTGSE